MKRLLFLLILFWATPAAAQYAVAAGATSQCFNVVLLDSTSTSGGVLTGKAFNSATLTCYYHRDNAASATSITMASSTLGTYTSGAFKEVDGTNMPGVYQFCPPDAALATGATNVTFECKGITNALPIYVRVALLQPNTFGYDGKLASESGTDLGLATGAIDADNQFASSHMLVVFDSAGLVEAASCITASTAATDHVTTRADISSLIAVNDNYIIVPDAACSVATVLLDTTPGGNGSDWFLIIRKRRMFS